MNDVYKKTESVVTREIAGETMLIPITGNLADMQNIFTLDQVSSLIWNSIDGSRDLNTIAELIVNDFDVSVKIATDDAEAFIDELKNAGLVEPA